MIFVSKAGTEVMQGRIDPETLFVSKAGTEVMQGRDNLCVGSILDYAEPGLSGDSFFWSGNFGKSESPASTKQPSPHRNI